MQFYMAPMEGVTGYIYRNAYFRYFGDADRYFTPFLTNKKLSYKEINDVLPEHNAGMRVVPQILTNKAKDFVDIAEELRQFGYDTVNLNLGCPSGTVAAKKKGAGFLALPEELDHFLEEIFTSCPLRISVKTRIGKDSVDEWDRLLSIYEKYPLEELIIHPRLQKEFYKNTPHLDAFDTAVKRSRHSLCYNGDIHSVGAYLAFLERFSAGSKTLEADKVMLGRGILGNPGLIGAIRGSKPVQKETIKAFHDEILDAYRGIMHGERNTLFKMKELWFYLGKSFTNPDKYLKKIKKAERIRDYEIAVHTLFEEQEYVEGK